MSDEDDEYEYEYDDDDGGGNEADGMEEDDNNDEDNSFEYTDEEEDQDDAEVALENAYYNAKGIRDSSDLNHVVAAFESVIQQEQNEMEKSSGGGGNSSATSMKKRYGPWSYKSMKQLVKLHLRAATTAGAGNDGSVDSKVSPAMIIHHYNRLLECVSVGDVSPAAVEKGISGMLERVARANLGSDDSPRSLALSVYDATLTVFHPVTGPCKNERLWFKTNLKYGQLLYEMNETSKLQQVLKDLLAIQNSNTDERTANSNYSSINSGGSNNSTNSMEIYALQIQLYSRQKDHKKLRDTYQRAMNVMGGIPHPRTLALIHELGGKMHMSSREYESAGKTFFQAFKSYDEAGDIGRLRCLKYLVLASMLHASTINPFDSQEARPYRDDPEIVAMTALVSAFHNNEIQKFESILKRHSKQLLGDEFIREHIEDLLRTIRTQVLLRLIRPYNRISLAALAAELNDIPIAAVEQLLVHQILEGNLPGAKIDRVNNILLKLPERCSSKAGGGISTEPAGSAMQSPQGSSLLGSSVATVSSNGGSGGGGGSGSNGTGSRSLFGSNDLLLQCEAMDSLIHMLDELSTEIICAPFLMVPRSSSAGRTMAMGSGSGGSYSGGMFTSHKV